LGLALAALGVLVLAETVLAGLGRPPLLVDPGGIGSTARALSWDDPGLLPVWVGLIAAGVVLWLLAGLRGQPGVIPLPAGEGRYADINRRSVGSVLADVAQDQDGVRSASASLTRSAARVEVVVRPGADVRAVRQRVESAVTDRLAGLQLERVRPRVSLSRSRERG